MPGPSQLSINAEESTPASREASRRQRRNHPASRATDALVRAGRASDLHDLYDRHGRTAQANYRAILDDDSRSADWKAEQLNSTAATVMENFDRELVALARDAEAEDQRDAERVFGMTGLTGDAASVAISVRDAADRVATAPADELQDLLERATRVGDHALARAVVQRAIDEGYAPVVDDFTDQRPDLREATERLWKRARRQQGAGFQFAMKRAALKPPPLNPAGAPYSATSPLERSFRDAVGGG